MGRVEITYQSAPMWKVGEDGALRLLNAANRTAYVGDDHYPADYTGRIQSVREAERRLGPLRTKGFWRSVVMELDAVELADARQRKLRVVGAMLRPITIEDSYGAIAPNLRERFGDDASIRERECRGMRGKSDEVADKDFWEAFFEELKALSRTQAHTGAGLYVTDVDGATTSDTVGAYNDNILPQSEDFGTTWDPIGLTAVRDTLAAPLNAHITADSIITTAGGTYHHIRQTLTFLNATQYTFSIYAKANGYDELRLGLSDTSAFPNSAYAYFHLGTGTVGTQGAGLDSAAISDIGGGWYRCSITATSDAADTSQTEIWICDTGETTNFSADGTSGLYVWGAQIETAATASVYKPTRASGETSITLQTGGLTDGDHDGEFLNFTVNDNDFQIIRNGADSVLVTADATGEGGAATALTFAPHVTIQGAADQLFADQGATDFTFSQYVRIFAGTYAENVVFNSTIDGGILAGAALVIEGDPNDSRENIVIAPGAGIGLDMYTDPLIVRHLKMTNNIRLWINAYYCEITDLHIDTTVASTTCIYWYAGSVYIHDCRLVAHSGDVVLQGTTLTRSHLIIESCEAYGHSLSTFYYQNIMILGCAIHLQGNNGRLFGDGGGAAQWNLISVRVVNCTIYGTSGVTTFGIYYNQALRTEFINNIWDDVEYPVYYISGANVPNETAAHWGPTFKLRSNYFFGITGFYCNGGQTLSYAEFAALSGVDASGDVVGVDPLLTDPANSDLTLQAGSPCINAGIGSGVVTDAYGNAAPNVYHPAIGSDFSLDIPEEDYGAPDLSLKVTRS